MAKSVTYRDLPKDIDPVAFLFGDDKFTVPQSYLTPKLTARFYQRALQTVDMYALHNRSEDNPHGLETLPSMLRYEPGNYGTKWLRLEADRPVIEPALPRKTSYQLQYLALFGFRLPEWRDIPLILVQEERFGSLLKIMGEIETTALLFGKNGQLYFVTGRWKPEHDYYSGGGSEPRYLEDGPYVFNLSHLTVEVTDWSDPRILRKIEDGQWSDTHAFLANLQLTLDGTARILEVRAKNMRHTARRFEKMSIYYGR